MRELKQWAGMILALVALFAGAAMAEERLCVTVDGGVILLDAAGNEVLPMGVYEELFCVVPGEAYAAGQTADGAMRYILLDENGEQLSDRYAAMFAASDDVILFRQSQRYGAISRGGEVLLDALYTQLATTGDGGFVALFTDPYDDEADELLTIDAEGVVSHTGLYTASGLKPFSEGLAPFRAPDTETYGYIDERGEIAIEADYDYACDFEDGMARVVQDGLFGVLLPSGSWMIPPKYSFLEIGESVIVGLQNEECCIVWDAATGAELFRVEGENMVVALLADMPVIVNGGETTLYSREGGAVLTLDADSTLSPGAGSQLLLSEGDWGTRCVSIVNADGTRLERRDQQLLPLDDSRYAFMTMRVAAYNSNVLGEIRYSCDYDSIRYGMIDLSGREILPAEYLEIRRVGEERYLTVTENAYSVVDAEGNVLWSLDSPANEDN